MPQITFTFTVEQSVRTSRAEQTLDPIPFQEDTNIPVVNPRTDLPWTDLDWWKRCVMKHLRENVRKADRKIAFKNAEDSLETSVDIGG
jgi:hypothetical protein